MKQFEILYKVNLLLDRFGITVDVPKSSCFYVVNGYGSRLIGARCDYFLALKLAEERSFEKPIIYTEEEYQALGLRDKLNT